MKPKPKYTIEHKYYSGWELWPTNDCSPHLYNTIKQAEKDIQDFVKQNGAGYTIKEKRITPITPKVLLRIEKLKILKQIIDIDHPNKTKEIK